MKAASRIFTLLLVSRYTCEWSSKTNLHFTQFSGWITMNGREKQEMVFSQIVEKVSQKREAQTHTDQAHPQFFLLIHTHTLGWRALMESYGLAGLIPPLSTVIGRFLSDVETHTQTNNQICVCHFFLSCLSLHRLVSFRLLLSAVLHHG